MALAHNVVIEQVNPLFQETQSQHETDSELNEESTASSPQQEYNESINAFDVLLHPLYILRSIISGVFSLVASIFKGCAAVLMLSFTNHMPTKQLHAVSIVLLFIHMLLKKSLDILPSLLIKLFLFIGGEETFEINHAAPVKMSTSIYSSKWNTDILKLEMIFEQILTRGLLSEKFLARSHNFSSSNNIKWTTFMDTPLTALMLPTTILSIFLLITMTMFLAFHVIFQCCMFFSSWSNGHNSSGSTSSSPVFMAGIMFLLLLENILPWAFFASGFYLSFQIGGVVWLLFTVSTYILWISLRCLRSFVFSRFQDGRDLF